MLAEAESFEWDFDSLAHADRAALASIASLYGLAGLLCHRGRLDRRLFLDSWANSVSENFRRLEPYRAWRMRKFGDELGSNWVHFAWLARVSDRHLTALGRTVPKSGA
jgi:hypothetical protein